MLRTTGRSSSTVKALFSTPSLVWDNVKDLRKVRPTEDLWIQSDCVDRELSSEKNATRRWKKLGKMGDKSLYF